MKVLSPRSLVFVLPAVFILFIAPLAPLSTLATASGNGPQSADPPPPPPPKLPAGNDPAPRGQDDLKIGTDLVVLYVTVIDQSNKPAMDLKEQQFQVMEDKVPQKIAFFDREQVPVSLVFAIDTSGSMRIKLPIVIQAATTLVRDSRAGDELAVIEFKDQPELIEEFTGDVTDVAAALQGLAASRQTAMLDALYLAADYAHKEGQNKRKAVVLVTDGLDKNSYYKVEEVANHLREIDVQVYTIGFTGDLSKTGALIFGKSEKGKADSLLSKIANETGGRSFLPAQLADVPGIAQQISTDLRTQYSIGYYPTNAKRDGTFRAIKVEVNAPNRRLVARTRNGYTAPH